jgi:hypothetical protein
MVDPMTTKLEMMIGYLAGKQGTAAETIRRELEEPASEASRWLAAMQRRSQAILRSSPPKAQDLIPPASMRNDMYAHGPARRRLLPFLCGVSAASAILLAMGVAWRAQENRLLRLGTMLTERDAELGTRLDQLNAALTKRRAAPPDHAQAAKQSVPLKANPPVTVDETTGPALARIEARLGEVGDRLRETQASQSPSDPMIDELRRDVERLRKDVEARAQLNSQESREQSMVIQEVLQLLRQQALRPWGPGQTQVPVPVPVPMQEFPRRGGHGPGHMPGAEQIPGQPQIPDENHFRQDAGQGDREGRPQGHSGGFMRPRIQRPGGPG